MSILGRLFGAKKPNDDLLNTTVAVREFLTAGSWREQQQLLETRPELLGATAELMLTRFLEEARDDDSRSVATQRLLLIRRSRDRGPKYSVREAQLIYSFADAASWSDGVRLLRQHSDIVLTEYAESLLQQLRTSTLGHREAFVDEIISLLRRTRKYGVDAIDGLVTLWDAVTIEEERSVVERYPILLSEAVEALINDFKNETSDEDELAELERYRLLLGRSREIGTAAAFAERAHPDLERTLKNLDRHEGSTLGERIELYRHALSMVPQGRSPKVWARLQSELGVCLGNLYEGDREKNLEEAITALDKALTIYKEDDGDTWARTLCNLAALYTQRIHGDKTSNIEKAIELCEQGLSIVDEGSEMSGDLYAVLGVAYTDRFAGSRAQNTGKAIRAFEQSRVLIGRENPEHWAMVLNNAGRAYLQLETTEGNRHAFDAFEEVIKSVTKESVPQLWAAAAVNLGIIYCRLKDKERRENLERAIGLYQDALTVLAVDRVPIENARVRTLLAEAYMKRLAGERIDNQRLALLQLSAAASVPGLDGRTSVRVNRQLGDILFKTQNWKEAAAAYEISTDANEKFFATTGLLETKQYEVGQAEDETTKLCYSLAKLGQMQRAVVALERGRGRIFADQLIINQELFQKLDAADRAELVELNSHLRRLQDRIQLDTVNRKEQLTVLEELDDHYRRRLALIEKVRVYLPGFLDKITFSDIKAVASRAPLIYLLQTEFGGLALLVSQKEIKAVWLKDLGGLIGNEQLDRYFRAYSNWRQQPQYLANRDTWFGALDDITSWLWSAAMEPVLREASKTSKVVLIPVGWLSFLPLHAAWTEDRTAPSNRRTVLDCFQVTVAPSARMLKTITERVARQADSILVVDAPAPVTAPPLPYSNAEANIVKATFPNARHLAGEDASYENVLASIGSFTALHFSCHAYANADNALESGLLLSHDRFLTVRQLLNVSLSGTRLAFLSACETNIPSPDIPDEMLSISAALLQAGVAGVIASLWPVTEVSTLILSAKFYQLWQQESVEPARALRESQQWIRDTTNAQKRQFVEECLQKSPGLPSESMKILSRSMLLSDPNGRDFSHPYFWAPFVYAGG
jgi:CHAT domain-containing protein